MPVYLATYLPTYLPTIHMFSGSLIGNYMCEHPDIRKVGFTGSTPVGKTIMSK